MLQPHHFDPTVLREYDVRGIIGQTLSEADAQALGASFATYVKLHEKVASPKICVGFDGRLSSPGLEEALVAGLMAAGAQAIRVGLGPTPMLYYATKHEDADGGMMITGSHNPPDYNGFKMLTRSGPVYGAMIQELGKIARDGSYASGAGHHSKKDLREIYVQRLLKDYDGTQPLKVVWDAGNGATGEIMKMLTAKLPGEHILLFEQIDGTFPNHHPDPTEEHNLIDLRAAMKKHGANVGIAFDGDGDRIGALDEQGRVVAGDQLLALYARDMLKTKPGAMVIGDVKVSQSVFDDIAAAGGKPLMWKTGHSLLKAKMKETGAPLAGEMSGHIFFADKYYGFDDALYGAVRLINLVSRSGGSLAALRDKLPVVHNTPEIRIPSSEARKFEVVAEIKARLKAAGANVNDIDGVRVSNGNGWWLLRASNTQDVMVARAEALNPEALQKLKTEIMDQLSQSGIILKI